MDEYITKEAAIEVFEWGEADVIEDYGDGCDFGFSRGIIKSAINAIPAADVAPVVHGRWEPCFDENCKCRWGFGKCSNCGQEYYAHAINYYKYCTNCGAKMDGGAK